jgi:hypothetical protein
VRKISASERVAVFPRPGDTGDRPSLRGVEKMRVRGGDGGGGLHDGGDGDDG